MANEISKETMEQHKRIAKLMVAGVSQTQIAQAVNLTDGRISQLLSDEAFLQTLELVAAEKAEQHTEIANGWDSIEAKALEIVKDNLKWNKNPDFALKAAMVANRAARRNNMPHPSQNIPLEPGKAGPRVVINLGNQYLMQIGAKLPNDVPGVVEQPQQVQTVAQPQAQKRHDFVTPEKVESLLKAFANSSHMRVEEPEMALAGFGSASW